MLIKREPLQAESEALVHVQGRHPLRNILVNGKGQAEEVIYLFLVMEIELFDVHRKMRRQAVAFRNYMDFARSAI